MRDVIAHIVGSEHDRDRLWKTGGNIDAANELSVERRREIPVQQLVAEPREIVPVRGLARLFAGLILIDNWIHQEDIRHPLGRLRAHHPERLRWVLRGARLTPYSRAKGLRLVATDLDVAFGHGPEVRGPAAELIMAVVGRRLPRVGSGALADLEGPGLAQLMGGT